MTKYEELEEEAREKGLIVLELPLQHSDGMIRGEKIGIRKGQSTTEKTCVLAEEIAHADLTVGNILDQSDARNRRQERLARAQAYDRLIGISRLVSAIQSGHREKYEIADYLGVTEPFLQEAIERYKEHYGLMVRFGDYIVQFEPWVTVIEMII